jgi:hypothetical protein
MLSHANLVRHTLSPQSKRRDERRTSRPACGPTACTASPRASGHSVRSPPRGCILRTCIARYRCMHMHSHRAPFHLCVLHCALARALDASQPHTVTHPRAAPFAAQAGLLGARAELWARATAPHALGQGWPAPTEIVTRPCPGTRTRVHVFEIVRPSGPAPGDARLAHRGVARGRLPCRIAACDCTRRPHPAHALNPAPRVLLRTRAPCMLRAMRWVGAAACG